jgi:outer membrane protein
MNQLKTRKPVSRFLIWLALLCSGTLYGQTTSSKQLLPDAPQVSLVALVQQDAAPMQQGSSEVSAAQPMSAVSSQKPRLTQSDAEKLAIKNNPRVSVAHLLALAQHQVVREARAAELPTGTANITAEDAENASRLSAGSLTASRLFEHAGAGGGFTQLITDFGKTRNLVASSKLQEKAQSANALASIEDIASVIT